MTYDELAVGLLDLLRSVASNPYRDQASQHAAAARVAEIEAGIRKQATYSSGPEYEARLARSALLQWDTISYVPAVTPEGEHDSLDTPRLMARRAMGPAGHRGFGWGWAWHNSKERSALMKGLVGLLLLLLLFGLAFGLGDAFGPGYGEALLIFLAVGISIRQLLSNRRLGGTSAIDGYWTAAAWNGANNVRAARPAADAPAGRRDYRSRG